MVLSEIFVYFEPGASGKREYYPGEYLKGVVQLHINRVQIVRGFYVEVLGKAECHWEEGDSRDLREYKMDELFANQKIYLFGSAAGPKIEMQSSVKEYSFTYQIPFNIPYTLNITNGSINFFFKACLDIPFGFDDEVRLPLMILSRYDLNWFPDTLKPFKSKNDETFMSLSSNAGPLTVLFSLPHTGFAVEQDVPLKISYDNKSSVDIHKTKVILNQKIIFHRKKPGNVSWLIHDEDLTHFNFEGVKAKSCNDVDATFKIPQCMRSNDKFCKIIHVIYFIKVYLKVSGLHKDLKYVIPISIGDVRVGSSQRLPVPLPSNTSSNQVEAFSPLNSASFGTLMNPPYPKLSNEPATSCYPPAMSVSPFSAKPTAPSALLSDDDMPPSFEEAMKMTKVVDSTKNIPSTSNNLGWNV